MDEKQKAILEKIAQVLKKMNEAQLERFVSFSEGMAAMVIVLPKQEPQKSA